MDERGLNNIMRAVGTMKLAPLAEIALKAISADSSSVPKLTVETFANHIYYYADVDTDRCLALIQRIRDTDSWLRNERITRGIEDMPPIPIWLHIQSNGGDLFAGFSTADQLEKISTPIYSVVEGVCASAATLLSMACTKRFIMPNAFFLIHQFSTAMWGKHEEFKDEMKLQERLMDRLADFYVRKSGMPESEIRAMLTHDTWMDADEAVAKGFVDELA